MSPNFPRLNRRVGWVDRCRKSRSEIPPHFKILERLASISGIDAAGVAAIKRGIVKRWFEEGRAFRDYKCTWWVDPSAIRDLPREMFTLPAMESLPPLRPGEWNIRAPAVGVGRRVLEPAVRAEENLRRAARLLLTQKNPPYRVVRVIVKCAEAAKGTS